MCLRRDEIFELEMGKLLRDMGAPLNKFAYGDFFAAVCHLIAAFEQCAYFFSAAIEPGLNLQRRNPTGRHAPSLGEPFRHGLARRMEKPNAIAVLDCLVHRGEGFTDSATGCDSAHSLRIVRPSFTPAAYEQTNDGRSCHQGVADQKPR